MGKEEQRARLRQVGKKLHRVSGQSQVALPREMGLAREQVEEFLVEAAGTARLRKGDLVLRRAKKELFTKQLKLDIKRLANLSPA